MSILKTFTGINSLYKILGFILVIFFIFSSCLSDSSSIKTEKVPATVDGKTSKNNDEKSVISLLISPFNPVPGEKFRVLATGGSGILNSQIIIKNHSDIFKSDNSRTGEEFQNWRIDGFKGIPEGRYEVSLVKDNQTLRSIELIVKTGSTVPQQPVVWKTTRGWDSGMEDVYSAWINALFQGYDEQKSWKALHEVTQNPEKNFLYNYLSLGEDDPDGKISVIMQPDCADNPFYLRAYFAWKLGLPFGFHVCDRGSLERKPKAGMWITNEMSTSKKNQVAAFNSFLRTVMNGVQSATARTALDDENSDYYPVQLEDKTLRPGAVFADPYGHTLILTGRVPQSKNHPGKLLSVDAQPDGTVGIKRFWKGNFLFNTSGVIGEAGFKIFRPIQLSGGKVHLMKNKELSKTSGFIPYSLQQRKMESEVFYHTMERIINPKPLDAEVALFDLIQALHEQLLVRVTSVANGEEYFRSHPGAVVPMPSSAAAIFQTGGQWEDFSTPNRDLRLLIAIDAIVEFPDVVSRSPGDFKVSGSTPEEIKKELQSMLSKKAKELSISYTKTDGTVQKLTMAEILQRKEAFEIAYNPNDGVEIRWGAPEKSSERASCRRHAPANQIERMKSVRHWFSKRLHPPT